MAVVVAKAGFVGQLGRKDVSLAKCEVLADEASIPLVIEGASVEDRTKRSGPVEALIRLAEAAECLVFGRDVPVSASVERKRVIDNWAIDLAVVRCWFRSIHVGAGVQRKNLQRN